MVDVQTIGVLVTAASVTVAAIYYMITLRNNNRTREAQLFTQIFQTFISSGLSGYGNEIGRWEWKDFDDFKRIVQDPEKFRKYSDVEMYFEGLGVLVYRRLVNPEFIEEFMGGDLIEYWDRMRLINKGLRERRNPRWGEFQEYMVNEVKQIREKRQPVINLTYTQ